MKLVALITAVLILLLYACDNSESAGFLETGAINRNTTIRIQPFDDLPDSYVGRVSIEIKKICRNVELEKPVPLPAKTYYKQRNRYRADSLIRYLKAFGNDSCVVIGLTGKDISHTKGNVNDYGIMGLGYRPGPSCVVSTFRLSKKNTENQFFKLCIHELGHTQGLAHCPVKSCFMRDAEGRNYFDEESVFCENCRNFLVGKGWRFN